MRRGGGQCIDSCRCWNGSTVQQDIHYKRSYKITASAHSGPFIFINVLVHSQRRSKNVLHAHRPPRKRRGAGFGHADEGLDGCDGAGAAAVGDPPLGEKLTAKTSADKEGQDCTCANDEREDPRGRCWGVRGRRVERARQNVK